MGIYLNPGKERYEIALNSEIYVDKTLAIGYLNSVVNTEQRYICVSRPRRFGKTMAANMICAYYDRSIDSRGVFEKLDISTVGSGIRKWDLYLNQFDVIHIVMTDFVKKTKSVEESLEKMTSRILGELSSIYPDEEYDTSDLAFSLEKHYRKSGTQFVFVIDEWDAVFRIKKDDKEGQVAYLDYLRDCLKDKEYIALAYMTGILPIKKYGEHSALNMFDEYSMVSPGAMAEYFGFTEEEVRKLCEQYKTDYGRIKEWYDGYELLSRSIRHSSGSVKIEELKPINIYSPKSVVDALRNGKLDNYWNATETFEALKLHISRSEIGLKESVSAMMSGERIRINIKKYQNDMNSFATADDVLTMLIHLGYLGYDADQEKAFIPNKEVMDEYRNSVEGDSSYDALFQIINESQRLLEATWKGDEDLVAELIERAHRNAAKQTYNNEAALSYSIRLAYIAALKYYTIIPELDSGDGFADLAFIPNPHYPDKPALVVELKWNKKADTALEQIKKNHYPDRLEHYRGNLILVGINYDKDLKSKSRKSKHHTCIIERA